MLAVLVVIVFSGCDDDEPKVLGLNEAAKFGWIKLTFDGTRPDGVPFKATKTYKYITGAGPAGSSTLRIYDDEGVTMHELRATRLYDPFDGSSKSANITLRVAEEDGDLVLTQATTSFSISLTFDDQTAMNLVGTYGPIPVENVTYTYNEENGKFKVKFTTVFEADWNSTDYDLTVTGEASVTLYEPLD